MFATPEQLGQFRLSELEFTYKTLATYLPADKQEHLNRLFQYCEGVANLAICYEGQLKGGVLGGTDISALRNQVIDYQTQFNSYEAQLQQMGEQAQKATVVLSLFPEIETTVLDEESEAYRTIQNKEFNTLNNYKNRNNKDALNKKILNVDQKVSALQAQMKTVYKDMITATIKQDVVKKWKAMEDKRLEQHEIEKYESLLAAIEKRKRKREEEAKQEDEQSYLLQKMLENKRAKLDL